MLTYITAFIDNSKLKTVDMYLESFEKMAQSGVPILLYFDEKYKNTEYDHRILTTYPNVQIPEYITIYKLTQEPVLLPNSRNKEKDTEDYLFIQLMKMKLLVNSLKYTDTKYLGWIDFGIFSIFKDITRAQEKLKYLYDCEFKTDKIIIAGCYGYAEPIYNIIHIIHWYFCGGFLIGHRDLFKHAYEIQTNLVKINLPYITWEINYWYLMRDLFYKYDSDHDDTILDAPIL